MCVYKKDPGRPPLLNLEQLYKKELPIPQAKKNDLLQLCKRGVIPKEDHRFFQLLKINKDKMTDKTPEPTVQLRNTLLTFNPQSARKLKEVKFLHLSVFK